ncbi:MAG: TolC family protein, partial [Acidobacteriota bacterium]
MRRALLISLLAVTGCASTDAPAPVGEAEALAGLRGSWTQEPKAAVRSALPPTVAGLIGDPQLLALVSKALEGNTDLRETGLRLRESGALLGVERSRLRPEVEGTLGQSRGAEGGGSASSTSSLGLALRWEVDVWGRLADQLDAAELRHAALEGDLRAARNSLAARTLRAG